MLEDRVLPAWILVASMPTPRSEFAAVAAGDGRIYAIGGMDASSNPIAIVEAYTPATNSWATVASLSTPRANFAAVAGADGRIYVVGGTVTAGLTNLVEAYNPASNVWTQVATLPTPRSGLAAATGSDGHIYAIGGENVSNAPVATVEIYTPATNSWATGSSLNTARWGLAAAEGSDGRIYAIGGMGASAPSNVVEAFKPGSRRWTTETGMPTLRSGLAAAVGADGRIYAIGGLDTNSKQVSVVEAYTTASNSWATAPTLSVARSALAAAEGSDGRVYALGGTSGTAPLSTVEALAVASKPGTTTTVASAPNPSVSGQAVTFTGMVSALTGGAGTPTGTVQFQIDGRNAGRPVNLSASGGVSSASFSTSMLMVGTRTITASYSGDNNFAASSSTLAGGQTVNKASTSTAVISSINPAVSGQMIVFTATVSVTAPGAGAPTGTVQFQIDGANAGTPVSVSSAGGVVTASFSSASLAMGAHTLTASYGGDANFAPSSGALSPDQGVTIMGTAATTITVSTAMNPALFGQMLTFTAAVDGGGAGTPTGTVQFQIDGRSAGNPVSVSPSGGAAIASFRHRQIQQPCGLAKRPGSLPIAAAHLLLSALSLCHP